MYVYLIITLSSDIVGTSPSIPQQCTETQTQTVTVNDILTSTLTMATTSITTTTTITTSITTTSTIPATTKLRTTTTIIVTTSTSTTTTTVTASPVSDSPLLEQLSEAQDSQTAWKAVAILLLIVSVLTIAIGVVLGFYFRKKIMPKEKLKVVTLSLNENYGIAVNEGTVNSLTYL